MIVQIAFTFCMLVNANECRVETRAFDGPLMACTLYGQQAAMEWLNSHPKWAMKRWRCGLVDPRTASRSS
jgi:hypothetical protein